MLVVEFVAGTRLHREPPLATHLPIVGNGPPGTRVELPDGTEVPLPTDQIVSVEDGDAAGGGLRVGFGGMSFAGRFAGQLVFLRVHEVQPEAELSPERSRRMTLEPHMVASITEDGHVVWPALN